MTDARKGKRVSAARRIALEVLRRVEAEGAFATLALDHALKRNAQLAPEDRALITQLVYGTLRWRRRLDYALAAHSRRSLDRIEPTLLRILRMTAFQLLFLERIPDWAAVDEATQLAVTLRGKRAGGFVNAVSRGLAGTRDQIDWPDEKRNLIDYLAVVHSFPSWMVRQWLNRFGRERTEQLLVACNQQAPLWVRINTIREPAHRVTGLLTASGIRVTPCPWVPNALRLSGAGDVSSVAAHEAGLLHVQDAAAQAVCQLAAPQPGQRVLDACAAPGGKTATLAQLMENRGELVALDRHPARLGLVRKLVERLGIGIVERVVGDLNEVEPSRLGSFDRVLLDAPCTALGVLRRHPEGKWRLFREDLDRMAQMQSNLLDRAGAWVSPGGCLVYSVCTLSEEEGPQVVRSFLERHSAFELEDPRRQRRAAWHALLTAEGTLNSWPDLHDMDGFFAVRLRRKPA